MGFLRRSGGEQPKRSKTQFDQGLAETRAIQSEYAALFGTYGGVIMGFTHKERGLLPGIKTSKTNMPVVVKLAIQLGLSTESIPDKYLSESDRQESAAWVIVRKIPRQ